MNKLALTVAAAMLTAAFAAGAAPAASGVQAASPAGTIYEWVDDSGQKHASDTVPEKYKGVARRVDPSRYQVPAGEQQEAERQAAALKARASAIPLSRPASEAAPAGTARVASLSGSPPVPDTPECVAWRRQLAASRECFFSYSNPDGSGRGLRSCSNEPDPEPPDPACKPEGSR